MPANRIGYVVFGLAAVLIVLGAYFLASSTNEEQAACEKAGGVYVKSARGWDCVEAMRKATR